MDLKPELKYTGGERGWVGDNPFICLDTSRIRKLGWQPNETIESSVKKTIEYLVENQWLMTVRD